MKLVPGASTATTALGFELEYDRYATLHGTTDPDPELVFRADFFSEDPSVSPILNRYILRIQGGIVTPDKTT